MCIYVHVYCSFLILLRVLLLNAVLQQEVHLRLIRAIKFYLLTYLVDKR